MNNKYYTVCGIVEIEGKILLVRHTYGTAKNRILLPGGFVQENELPTDAIEREILEETGVIAKVKSVVTVQFKPNQWCVVFSMEYVSGTPKSDGYENDEVYLLSIEEAIKADNITNMSREVLSAYMTHRSELTRSSYVPASSNEKEYVIFGI